MPKCFLLLLFLSLNTFAIKERIPLFGKFLPANDLVTNDQGVLSSEQARFYNGDLSKLEPLKNDIYNARDNFLPLELPEYRDREFNFLGTMESQKGLFRFISEASNGEKVVFALDKNVHSILLRSSFLKKLGYILPDMKRVSKVTINFDSEADKKTFLDEKLYKGTGYTVAKRWVDSQTTTSVTLIDVVAYDFKDSFFYNLALGFPFKYASSRTVRATSLIYSLVNMKESVNKFSWKMAQKQENNILFEHFFPVSSKIDRTDAKWILNRLKKLERTDFEQIVESAGLPYSVSLLLIEKIISRRNQILELFEVSSTPIAFNYSPNHGEELVDGILKKERFDGYASVFAPGTPESPFKDLEYYVLSELRGDVLVELITRVNKELSVFDINEARMDWIKEDFQSGLEHYLNTGEFKERTIGTWFSPTLDGKVILSRDIVMGAQGQNDNVVQMGDTFGVSVALGGHMGIEGLDPGYGAYVKANMNFVKTYTHLRPLRNLKDAFKVPYKKMLVNFSKGNLKRSLDRLSESSEENDRLEIFDQLDELLGVGESLVITSSLSPKVIGKLSYTHVSGTSHGLSLSGDAIKISRIHLYRESRNVLQVYVDKGKALSWAIAYDLKQLVPILRLQYGEDRGKYGVDYFRVALSDQSEGATGVDGVVELLENGRKDVLVQTGSRALQLETSYTDKVTKFGLLWWRYKKVKKSGDYSVDLPGLNDTTLLRHSIEKLRGNNLRSFAEDVVNYFLIDKEKDFLFRSSPWKNPGHTPFGSSFTNHVTFEGIVNRKVGKIGEGYISIKEGLSGWKIKKRKLQKNIEKLNTKFATHLFSANDVYDATDLNLYDIAGHVNVYDRGIKNLLYSKTQAFRDTERSIIRNSYNHMRCDDNKARTIGQKIQCGDLTYVRNKAKKCRKLLERVSPSKYAKCTTELFSTLSKHLPFQYIYMLVGEENVYRYATINGFRKQSEYLNRPIESDTEGRIGSRSAYGPFNSIIRRYKIQASEFYGLWLREVL